MYVFVEGYGTVKKWHTACVLRRTVNGVLNLKFHAHVMKTC